MLPMLGARMAGVDSDGLAILQIIPTLILLVSSFLLVDWRLSPVVPGANDNASGVAVALSLADKLQEEPPRNLDVWVVLTGGEECGMEGMRSFARTHKDELDPFKTIVLAIDSVGKGDVRWVTAEGMTISFEMDPRVGQLCEAIAEADREDTNRYRAAALRHGFATDALAARVAGLRASTITCLEPGAITPGQLPRHPGRARRDRPAGHEARRQLHARPDPRARPRPGANEQENAGARSRIAQATSPPGTTAPRVSEKLWEPSAEAVERSNMTAYMRWLESERDLSFDGDYARLWEWSVEDVEDFWRSIWDYFDVAADGDATTVLTSAGMPGARVVPRHEPQLRRAHLSRQGPLSAGHPARRRGLGPRRDHMGRSVVAGRLIRRRPPLLGVERGDRVAAYLPNGPEAIVGFLASASIGAIWSSCSPDFGARSVIDRFAQIEPKVLLAVDGYTLRRQGL